jgi:putative thioredoxin
LSSVTVLDVNEAAFETEVIERSRELPVVVDFWAAWCGPCRALTPALEEAARKREGKVVLAKVDTDANQALAGAFGIQGIPAVKAFRDGRVVDEFVGARPPSAVEAFFDGLVPSEADTLVAAGDEAALRHALELDPRRADAAVGLARILHGRGDREGALALVDGMAGDFQAEGLAARLRLEGDPGAAAFADAFAALDAGEQERGLDLLLAAIESAADGVRDDIRRVFVAVLDSLGVEDPTAREYRRRLASALY